MFGKILLVPLLTKNANYKHCLKAKDNSLASATYIQMPFLPSIYRKHLFISIIICLQQRDTNFDHFSAPSSTFARICGAIL